MTWSRSGHSRQDVRGTMQFGVPCIGPGITCVVMADAGTPGGFPTLRYLIGRGQRRFTPQMRFVNNFDERESPACEPVAGTA